MKCKRCELDTHQTAASRLCPKNAINRKIGSWDASKLNGCLITDAVIAGFMDADGCFSWHREWGHATLSQSHNYGKDVLDLVKEYIGCGNITGPGKHDQYNLNFYGEAYEKVLGICSSNGVIKPTIQMWNITDEWLGGFFAGDGGLSWNGDHWELSFTQWSHPEVLVQIRDTLGCGHFDGKRLRFTGKNMRRIAYRIKDYTLHKRADLYEIF